MKLFNQISRKGFPMVKAGKYDGLRHDVTVDDYETKVEWTVEIKDAEAVLPLNYKVDVLEASKGDQALLKDALLTIRFDGELILKDGSLFKREWPLPLDRVFFMAIDQDEPRGIFVVNGTIIQATVELAKQPLKQIRLRVSIQADLYRTSKEEVKGEEVKRC